MYIKSISSLMACMVGLMPLGAQEEVSSPVNKPTEAEDIEPYRKAPELKDVPERRVEDQKVEAAEQEQKGNNQSGDATVEFAETVNLMPGTLSEEAKAKAQRRTTTFLIISVALFGAGFAAVKVSQGTEV